MEMRVFLAVTLWNSEMLPVPEQLGGYETLDILTHQPKKCYARLRNIGRQESDQFLMQQQPGN